MAKKDIKKEIQNKHSDFAEAVDRLSVSDLEQRLLNYAKETERVIAAFENDQEIIALSEKLKELKGPYNDTKKALQLKMRYINLLIAEKGGDAL